MQVRGSVIDVAFRCDEKEPASDGHGWTVSEMGASVRRPSTLGKPYAGTVQWAQDQARQAIALYNQGVQATQQAQSAYNQRVDAYNAAAQQYNENLSAGRNPGSAPTEPGAFTDPRVQGKRSRAISYGRSPCLP